MTTRKMNHHYEANAKKLGWEIIPTGHSMRISFVINAVRSGSSDEDIITVCRWADGSMLRYYKNHKLENTVFGSAYKINSNNQKVKSEKTPEKPMSERAPEEPQSDPIIIEDNSQEERTKRPKIETTIKLKRPSEEKAVQTKWKIKIIGWEEEEEKENEKTSGKENICKSEDKKPELIKSETSIYESLKKRRILAERF